LPHFVLVDPHSLFGWILQLVQSIYRDHLGIELAPKATQHDDLGNDLAATSGRAKIGHRVIRMAKDGRGWPAFGPKIANKALGCHATASRVLDGRYSFRRNLQTEKAK
jgi:hypothetical protein